MSGRIPKEFIQHILERSDIVAVINERLPLKKRSHNFIACCPFHHEKTPSFTVSPTKQIYHCFGCGAGGSVINFLMEFDRLHFIEAIDFLAKSLGIEVPQENAAIKLRKDNSNIDSNDIYKLMQKVNNYYQKQLQIHLPAQQYLQSRDLNLKSVEAFQLGYAPAGWHHLAALVNHHPKFMQLLIKSGMLIEKQGQTYDRFRDRLMFPIQDRRGYIIGFGGRIISQGEPKYLNSPETFIFQKSQEVYGLFNAKQSIRDRQQIIIVEGYMDVIALAQHGIHNAVATLGTAVTEDHIRLLLRYCKNLVFCFDGDNAGIQAAWRALENSLVFIHGGCDITFVFLDSGQDPDSYVRHQGKDAFLQAIQGAIPLSDVLLQHLSKKINLLSIDGKTQFVQQLKPLMNRIKDEVYQEFLCQKVSKLLQIETSKLQEILQLKKPSLDSKPRKTQKKHEMTPMRLIIALLIQHPHLVQCLDNKENFITKLPGQDLLMDLIEFLSHHPHINTGMLLEYFKDHPHINTIKKLANWELFIPSSGLTNEFMDTLKRIHMLSLEHKIEHLLAKANLHGLTNTERLELQRLIALKHKSVT